MERSERVILTNMCMVEDGKGKVLVENRRDPSWPGIAFPGGHILPGEAFAASAVREVWEETGLHIEKPKLCGVRQFPTREGIRYMVFLYRALACGGTLKASEEGEVVWVESEKLRDYPLAGNFAETIPLFFGEEAVEEYWQYQEGEWQREIF